MKSRAIRKILSLLMIFTLVLQQAGFAQGLGQLDIAKYIGAFSGPQQFRPLLLRYFSYDPLTDNFQLLLDKGNLKKIEDSQLKEQGQELLKYFLVGVALPDDNFWVNLRPDSEEQIIDEELVRTDLGKVLLEADLQLKKDVAKFTSPQTPEGREYWNKLYQKAGQIFSSQNITIPTLTRPWIVPGEVIIRETANSAYVYKGTLKVMLEQDHLKNSADYNFSDPRLKELNEYSSQLIRETIIPKLTKEVNSSKRYASLRQVFFSLILSRWFKHKFAGTSGQYASLINTGNLKGLTSQNTWSKTTYFEEYKKSFAQGEYNIKEQVNGLLGPVVRTYFSGGIAFAGELVMPNQSNPNSTLGTFTGSNPVVTRTLGNTMVNLAGTPNGELLPTLENKIWTGIASLRTGNSSSPIININDRIRELESNIAERQNRIEEIQADTTNNVKEIEEIRRRLSDPAISSFSSIRDDILDLEKQKENNLAAILRIREHIREMSSELRELREKATGASSPLQIDGGIEIPANQLQDFAGILKGRQLKVNNIKVIRLQGNMLPEELFVQPQVPFLIETSIAQALGSRLFAGGGAEIKDIADANAVHFSDEGIRAYVKANPNAAVVIIADEGKRDKSVSLEIGSIYYSGYEGLRKSFTDPETQKIKLNEFKDEIAALETKGVTLSFFVGDALEVTNGLVVKEALSGPTDSWSLTALLDQFNPLVNDNSRIGGISFNAPTDGGVTPFDLPSEALPKIAKAKGIETGSKEFEDFMNHTIVLTLGPRVIKKAYEATVKKHRHQAIIDDARKLQEKYPGLKLVLPGDGDLMPRVVSSLELDLDGYKMVTFGRSGSAEATAALLIAAIANNGQFSNSYVSGESTDGDYSRETAYKYTEGEIKAFNELGIPEEEYLNSRTKDVIKGKGIYAMSSVTGASANTFGESFSKLLQRVEITPTAIQGGMVTINTLVVARDGSVFEVHTQLSTPDLAKTQDSIKRASKEAKEYLREKGAASSPLGVESLSNMPSDPVKTPADVGGIDFRAIPMITQPMGNLSGLNFSLPHLSNVENINLDDELAQIQKLLRAGITPSGVRLKEFVAVCYQKGELSQYLDEIVASLVDICKLEEEKVDASANELKEVLLILDSIG